MLPPIYTILSAASAVSAIVGNRIYPHADAPLDVTAPYVTWFIVSAPPEIHLSGTPTHDRFTVQVDCWHPTSAGVTALASAARAALEAQCNVTNLMLNQRDPETRLYRLAVQLDYFLNR